jgi:hypothetical protein
MVANNQVITSIEKGTIKIPTKTDDSILPTYVFKDDSLTNNLAGLSNLTNMGCKVILDSETIFVIRDGEVIWSGTKGTNDKLWNLDLADLHSIPATPNLEVNQDVSLGCEHVCNMVLPGSTQSPVVSCVTSSTLPTCVAFQTIRHDNVAELVAHAHAVFASCPITTFLHAARASWLGNYPRLTPLMIQQNPPVSRDTAMGYLDQTRQGQKSTKLTPRQ